MTEDRIYAGDIVYDSDFLAGKSRGEIIEFLDDLCSRFFGTMPSEEERVSLGPAIDTILMLLDIAVKPAAIDRFKLYLEQQIAEYGGDSELCFEDVNPQYEAED